MIQRLVFSALAFALLLGVVSAFASESDPQQPQQPIPKDAEVFAAARNSQDAPLALFKSKGQCEVGYLAATFLRDGRVYATGCWVYRPEDKAVVIVWDDDKEVAAIPTRLFNVLNSKPAPQTL